MLKAVNYETCEISLKVNFFHSGHLVVSRSLVNKYNFLLSIECRVVCRGNALNDSLEFNMETKL